MCLLFIMVPFTPTFLSGIPTTQPSQPAVDPQSIAKQQADLQAKILSILNPGGVAKPGGTSTSPLSQQTALPNKSIGGVATQSVATPAKSAGLSTTAKPIFPLYPAQQKAATSSATGGYMSTSTSGVGVPLGATASKALSSSPANQIGKAPKTALPYGVAPASSSYGAASVGATPSTGYQFTKPAAPTVQSTYAVGANQAATVSSSSRFGSPAAQRSQPYSVGTQGQKPTTTSVTRSPIPVVSKVGPAGQAIGTIGAQRPAINSGQQVGRGAPTAVGGPRPVTTVTGGQMRAPSPILPKGRAGLLGASPTAGNVTRGPAQSGALRAPSPSGTPGVRMGAPRGPSPVGRGSVRTPSPVGIQGSARGGAIAVRGGGTSVRGGAASGTAGTGATGRTTTPGVAAPIRGALAQRGAPTTRGIPTRGGATGPTRGAPASRGAPPTRGAPASRGAPPTRGAPASRGAPVARGALASRGASASRGGPMSRGSPQMRGAPNGRGGPSPQGAPIRSLGLGGRPSGQGPPMNRGAPRGRPMMRGGPAFRGGRGTSGGYGGYGGY